MKPGACRPAGPWYQFCSSRVMKDNSFRIQVSYRGVQYEGWVKPAEKDRIDGKPTSFHVVLNDVFFGNLSQNNRKWSIDEQRPQELVELVGNYIERRYE